MRSATKVIATVSALSVLSGLLVAIEPPPARAIPSFARQTGFDCNVCHTNFPQLTPFGRQFKAHGYLLTNNADSASHGLLDDNNLPHLAFMVEGGFTNTKKGQQGGAAQGFDNNNNWALNQLSFLYGGIVVPDWIGAFVQGTYNGPNGQDAYWSWDNADVRLARDTTLADRELVLGVSVNNNPTVQDLWNTTPAWSFPFTSSVLGPTPAAGTLIQESLAQQVLGASAYALYDQHWYAEAGAYTSLSHSAQRSLGLQNTDVSTEHQIDGGAPYWRFAYQQDWGDQNVAVGTFGLAAPVHPNRTGSEGQDWYTDVGVDTQYQWLSDPSTVSVTGSFINEFQNFDASRSLGLSDRRNGHLYSVGLSTMYMYDKTYSGTIGYNNWYGDKNAAYYGTDNGSPDSDQWTFEVDWLPFNKDGGPSFWPKSNLKLGVQYVAYSKFDGSTQNASDNNTLFVYGWLAF